METTTVEMCNQENTFKAAAEIMETYLTSRGVLRHLQEISFVDILPDTTRPVQCYCDDTRLLHEDSSIATVDKTIILISTPMYTKTANPNVSTTTTTPMATSNDTTNRFTTAPSPSFTKNQLSTTCCGVPPTTHRALYLGILHWVVGGINLYAHTKLYKVLHLMLNQLDEKAEKEGNGPVEQLEEKNNPSKQTNLSDSLEIYSAECLLTDPDEPAIWKLRMTSIERRLEQMLNAPRLTNFSTSGAVDGGNIMGSYLQLLTDELDFVRLVLNLHPKSRHAWSYRRNLLEWNGVYRRNHCGGECMYLRELTFIAEQVTYRHSHHYHALAYWHWLYMRQKRLWACSAKRTMRGILDGIRYLAQLSAKNPLYFGPLHYKLGLLRELLWVKRITTVHGCASFLDAYVTESFNSLSLFPVYESQWQYRTCLLELAWDIPLRVMEQAEVGTPNLHEFYKDAINGMNALACNEVSYLAELQNTINEFEQNEAYVQLLDHFLHLAESMVLAVERLWNVCVAQSLNMAGRSLGETGGLNISIGLSAKEAVNDTRSLAFNFLCNIKSGIRCGYASSGNVIYDSSSWISPNISTKVATEVANNKTTSFGSSSSSDNKNYSISEAIQNSKVFQKCNIKLCSNTNTCVFPTSQIPSISFRLYGLFKRIDNLTEQLSN